MILNMNELEYEKRIQIGVALDSVFKAFRQTKWFEMFSGIADNSTEGYKCTYAIKALMFFYNEEGDKPVIEAINNLNKVLEHYGEKP